MHAINRQGHHGLVNNVYLEKESEFMFMRVTAGWIKLAKTGACTNSGCTSEFSLTNPRYEHMIQEK